MIKEKSQIWAKISQSLGHIFSHLPFAPDFYTWLTIPMALLGLTCTIMGAIGTAVVFFILAGFFDIVDGAIARHRRIASNHGAFLDGSLDRFVDCALLFSYFWLNIQTPWLTIGQWISLAIFFAIMPSFEVAYANHRQAVSDPDETLIWRILNRGEMYVLMLAIPIISLYSSVWAGYILVSLVCLSLITTFQTIFLTLKLASKAKSN